MKFTSILVGAVVAGALLVPISATPAGAQGPMRGSTQYSGRRMGRQRGTRVQGRMMDRGRMVGVPGLRDHPLTAEQARRIAKIRREGRQQNRTDTHERVMEVLTPEQRAEFMGQQSGRRGGNMGTRRHGRGMAGQPGGMMGDMGPGMGKGRGMGRGQGAMMGVPGLQEHPLTAEQARQIAQIRQEGRQQNRTDTHDRVMNTLTPEQIAEFQNWCANHPTSGQ